MVSLSLSLSLSLSFFFFSGKTVQSVSLIAFLMSEKKNRGPFLFIVPMSTLRNNWEFEFDRWLPSRCCVKLLYDGSKDNRKRLRETDLFAGNWNVLLTTYEFAMRDKKYLGKIKWEYIFVDEAHRLKNPKCRLSQVSGVVVMPPQNTDFFFSKQNTDFSFFKKNDILIF